MASAVKDCTLNTAPIWLGVVFTHWTNLVRRREWARPVVDAIFDLLVTVSNNPTSLPNTASTDTTQIKSTDDNASYREMTYYLTRAAKRLLEEHPLALLAPDKWEKHRATLQKMSSTWATGVRVSLSMIDQRNDSFIQEQKGMSESFLGMTQRKKLVTMLEQPPKTLNPQLLLAHCREMIKANDHPVNILCEWATTSFRDGAFRIYVVTMVLQSLVSEGLEFTEKFYDFIIACNERKINGVSIDNLAHLITELVRCQLFSISKYLTWMTSRGVLRPNSWRPEVCVAFQRSLSILTHLQFNNIDVQLIAALPTQSNESQVNFFRVSTLRTIGLRPNDEAIINTIKEQITQRWPAVYTHWFEQKKRKSVIDHASLSWSVKADVIRYLRRGMGDFCSTIWA